MSIGTNVRKWRKERGLAQHELAARAGLSPRTLAYTEADYGRPSPKTIAALASALGVSERDLAPYPPKANHRAINKGEMSERQQRILDFVRDHITRKGYAPTLREIMSGTGITSTSVASYNLKKLENAGHLRRQETGQRAIALVEETDPAADLRAVIQEAADDIEELAEWAAVLEPAEMRAAIRARAAGLRAALLSAGVAL